jgi:hypothetical protein
MNKDKKKPNKDFMMAFFDCNIPESFPDLAAKKESIKYIDSFTIFKVENDKRKSI